MAAASHESAHGKYHGARSGPLGSFAPDLSGSTLNLAPEFLLRLYNWLKFIKPGVPEAKTNAGQRLTLMNTLLNNRIAEVSLTYSSKVPASERIQIKSSHDAEKAFRLVFPDLEYREYFYVMLLNRANKILGTFQVSSGGITGTVVDPRLVFQSALKANATSLIVAHNHPSGQLTPSEADMELTKKLKAGGAVLDIPVLDHVIITESSYYSFADEGIM